MGGRTGFGSGQDLVGLARLDDNAPAASKRWGKTKLRQQFRVRLLRHEQRTIHGQVMTVPVYSMPELECESRQMEAEPCKDT